MTSPSPTISDDDELKRPFKCDECGERFTQPGAVPIHKMRKHLPMSKF